MITLSAMRTRRRLVVATVVTALAAAALAGCTAGATIGPPTSATATATTPASAPAGTGPSAPATSGAAATSAAAATSGATASGTAPPPSAAAAPRCSSAALSVSLGTGGGVAAGTSYVDLVLTSTAGRSCTLEGWPGVSLVGDGNGTQLGAAAGRDPSSPPATVTLAPGGSAHARLGIANALNYPPATCDPVTADGLRVYPPGETHALFLPTTQFTACRMAGAPLLNVTALQPGAA